MTSKKRQLVAVLLADLFQDAEAIYPYYRMKEAGYNAVTLGIDGGDSCTGKYGYHLPVDLNISQVSSADLTALIIPGGWAPDSLRQSEAVTSLVRNLIEKNKVVGAICHAGWVLASAEVLQGRTVTSYQAIRDDLIHAGAKWVDEEVVRDGNLITSRIPADLPAFCRTVIEALEESS